MRDPIFLMYDKQYQDLLRVYHEDLVALVADYNNEKLKAIHEADWEALQRRRREVLGE